MDKVEDKPVVCNSISDKDAGDFVSAVAVHDLQASWAGSMDSLTLDGVSFTISSVSCVVLLYVVCHNWCGKCFILILSRNLCWPWLEVWAQERYSMGGYVYRYCELTSSHYMHSFVAAVHATAVLVT